MATKGDIQVASLAAGFTIGFGFLTVWEAIKQTRRAHNSARNTYIYLVWGEILSNLALTIIGWLFLDGIVGPTVPVFFFILFFWAIEIHFLMQIIINRIEIIAENRKTIWRLKWGTALFISLINVAVFCVFIPAHIEPPLSETVVKVNVYWDRLSKVLILLVDAGLNWYFLKTVKSRLLDQHGLMKYKPLVSFNAKLMVVSIAMDGLLIGLMSLPNQVVFIQFHPVVYMVKLNIEMAMASLIAKLARDKTTGVVFNSNSHSDHRSGNRTLQGMDTEFQTFHKVGIQSVPPDERAERAMSGRSGIHRRLDVQVTVEDEVPNEKRGDVSSERTYRIDDEEALTSNAK